MWHECYSILGIGLAALVFLGGCESTPTVTRTGDVKDIIIGDNLSAAGVSINDKIAVIRQQPPRTLNQRAVGSIPTWPTKFLNNFRIHPYGCV